MRGKTLSMTLLGSVCTGSSRQATAVLTSFSITPDFAAFGAFSDTLKKRDTHNRQGTRKRKKRTTTTEPVDETIERTNST